MERMAGSVAYGARKSFYPRSAALPRHAQRQRSLSISAVSASIRLAQRRQRRSAARRRGRLAQYLCTKRTDVWSVLAGGSAGVPRSRVCPVNRPQRPINREEPCCRSKGGRAIGNCCTGGAVRVARLKSSFPKVARRNTGRAAHSSADGCGPRIAGSARRPGCLAYRRGCASLAFRYPFAKATMHLCARTRTHRERWPHLFGQSSEIFKWNVRGGHAANLIADSVAKYASSGVRSSRLE
ncbi:hypothetical protein QFZ91_000200 [Paraburkholderia sp. JPY419]